jgi:hypothetical protein
MTSLNLAIVVAPDLINGPDLREDLAMCLPAPERDGKVFGGARTAVGLPDSQGASLVDVIKMMLDERDAVRMHVRTAYASRDRLESC